MMMHIDLSDLMDVMESGPNEMEFIYNCTTQKIVVISTLVEGIPEIGLDDEFIRLPDRREIDEYGMMSAFVAQLPPQLREKFELTLQGSGVFHKFKNAAAANGRLEQWYAYRDRCYHEVALRWCHDHQIEPIDQPNPEQKSLAN